MALRARRPAPMWDGPSWMAREPIVQDAVQPGALESSAPVSSSAFQSIRDRVLARQRGEDVALPIRHVQLSASFREVYNQFVAESSADLPDKSRE